jgi:hypothetical protein
VTDGDIRRLLALKSEGPNLDYKGGFRVDQGEPRQEVRAGP